MMTYGKNSCSIQQTRYQEKLTWRREKRRVEPIRGRYCFVVVNGQKYPPSQVLYYSLRRQYLGLSLSDFRNDTAKNILEQIGFEPTAD
jgi:hypothetical protein